MEQEALNFYKKAGKINAEIMKEVLGMIKPGVKLLEIAEFAEGIVEKKGAGLAFPVNTSLNEIAAHYVAGEGDSKTVGEGDLLKIDLGVEVEGYIADAAVTYCSEKNPLVRAAESAVSEAVKVIRPGVLVGDVSQAVEETVKGAGFGLIVNLTGHGLDRNDFHAPPVIPMVATGSKETLEEGQVIALEPFVTERNGHVKESAPTEIFRFLQERPVRSPDARKVLGIIKEEYQGFPFAKRWLCQELSLARASIALRQLEAVQAVETFPPLKDVSGQKIAQHEHTIIVSDPPIVTTKL
ncbi:MAG: type II methionyl aminopeptidase [Candidatus Aenigmarchaeota archaeon]|nr:type II methionyl aminopeptidase [Candidatus Aenigmarchaeota archaeon]